MIRFLASNPRTIQRMARQRPPKFLDCYTDSNHAGCLRTRRSTSCTTLHYGGHFLKLSSTTQVPIALSSGESEWYGLVRAATCAIGYRSMAADFGVELRMRLTGDATAAAGIGMRRGAGRVRHIHTKTLWLQRRITDRDITLKREKGASLAADLGTKHVSRADLLRHLQKLGFEYRAGTSAKALKAQL